MMNWLYSVTLLVEYFRHLMESLFEDFVNIIVNILWLGCIWKNMVFEHAIIKLNCLKPLCVLRILVCVAVQWSFK